MYGEGETARATGWEITMGIWAIVCVVCFLITFATTRERLAPVSEHASSLKQDFGDLLKNGPWIVMATMTLIHFAIISLRGGAFYNYYHYYADQTAMFNWLASLGLTGPPLVDGQPAPGGLLEFLGWVAHGDRSNLAGSNVADVAQSVIGVIEKIVYIGMILLSPMLTARFGKKAIAFVGFALMTIVSALWYVPEPNQVGLMVALTVLGGIAYGPTIPVLWSMFADVADYSEWKNGRSATGIVFATICFALKAGLSLGSFLMLQLLAMYGYVPNQAQSAGALEGIRLTSSVYPTIMFVACTILLAVYKINKHMTLQIAAELAARRQQRAAAT
jgi:glycoside/pentoside/hexuronide:cation symporter, GPH family